MLSTRYRQGAGTPDSLLCSPEKTTGEPVHKNAKRKCAHLPKGLLASTRFGWMRCLWSMRPAASIRLLDKLCAPAKLNGQGKRAVNPVSPADVKRFAAAMRGGHFIHGFRNGNLATHLGIELSQDQKERRRQTSRIGRLLQLFRAHRLIAKLNRCPPPLPPSGSASSPGIAGPGHAALSPPAFGCLSPQIPIDRMSSIRRCMDTGHFNPVNGCYPSLSFRPRWNPPPQFERR